MFLLFIQAALGEEGWGWGWGVAKTAIKILPFHVKSNSDQVKELEWVKYATERK